VPGLGLAIYANVVAADHGLGPIPVVLFVAALAVPLFNAAHQPALPLVLLGLALAGILPTFWLVGALAWLGHIVVDMGLGDGRRTADGWRHRPVDEPA
jgi:hypothetical protein